MLQNPKRRKMKMDGIEREREWKIKLHNTSSRYGELGVRKGIYLYLERKNHPSWINAKCPPPSTRGNPKGRAQLLGFERWIHEVDEWVCVGIKQKR